MSRRTDIIVTACVLLSAAIGVLACASAFILGPAWAFLMFVAACYLVLLAMFVVMYGRDDG